MKIIGFILLVSLIYIFGYFIIRVWGYAWWKSKFEAFINTNKIKKGE